MIPAEATADVDVRILPDQDPDSVLAELKRVVADTAVHFTTLLAPKPPLASPATSAFFRAVERATYEDMLVNQIDAAISKSGPGSLEKLLNGGETWVVE